VGNLVTCGKTPTSVTWSERLKIYCRVVAMQRRPTVEQAPCKFRNLPLQAKERTWTNCNLINHCMFEQINRIRTAVYGHPQFSLKCRLPNLIRFDVFDRCFCKVEARTYETLRSCAKCLGQWFPTGEEFLPREEFHEFRRGISTL